MGRFFSHLDASWWSTGFLLLFFVLFLGLIAYWYNPRRKLECQRLGSLPLQSDDVERK